MGMNIGAPAVPCVKKGDQVLLTVSRGAEQIQIPDVAGKSRSVAENTLSERGFAVSVSEEYSDSVVSGAVIRQTPSAGRSAARGTTVSLVVSKGKKVTERTGVPVLYTTGKKEMLDIFASEGHDPKYYGELMPIDIYMKRDWESYIHSL